MTPQEAFEKALRGVIDQGEASYDAGRECCMYKYVKGRKELRCPVGHLMESDALEVFAKHQVMPAWLLARWGGKVTFGLDMEVHQAKEFLRALQHAHDDPARIPWKREGNYLLHFIEEMYAVAQRWKLRVPIDVMMTYVRSDVGE